MDKVTNNVLFDVDLLLNKDISLYSKMDSLNKIDKSKCGSLVEFIYKRQYIDEDTNPLKSIGINNEFDNYDCHKYDESLYDFICVNEPMMDLILEYCQNQYVNVTIVCNSATDKELLNEINIFRENAKYIIRKKDSPINIESYDTIYFPNHSYIPLYKFTENTHRKSILIANIRCNFMDNTKETLHLSYLSLGLKNDVYVVDIYNIETKENFEKGEESNAEI